MFIGRQYISECSLILKLWVVRKCYFLWKKPEILSFPSNKRLILYLNIWAALREKVPNVLSRCHTKKRTGSSFVMTQTFQKKNLKAGVIPKDGRMQHRVPILLLVWQRLRTLGTFSRVTAHIMLNPIEKFKVAILHLNRDWNHWFW